MRAIRRRNLATRRYFYFALPNLASRLRGQIRERVEGDPIEARLPGLAIFIVTCSFAFKMSANRLSGWQLEFFIVALPFTAFFFWVVILYLNSLVVRLLRTIDLFKSVPNNRAQSVLICGLTTLFAGTLAISASWMRFVGFAWIAGLALNLAAAAVIAIDDATGKGT